MYELVLWAIIGLLALLNIIKLIKIFKLQKEIQLYINYFKDVNEIYGTQVSLDEIFNEEEF